MTDPNYTHLALIVDRSGSMSRIVDDMNGGIRELLVAQSQYPGKLVVDVTRFDHETDPMYRGASADDVLNGDRIIVPRGSTALNDALGYTINALGDYFDEFDDENRPGKVICVIVTDGMENSSHEFSTDTIKRMVETQRDQFDWEFVFLGTNIDAFETAAALGVPRGSTMSFDYSGEGAVASASAASNYMTRSRTGLVPDFTDAERAEADLA